MGLFSWVAVIVTFSCVAYSFHLADKAKPKKGGRFLTLILAFFASAAIAVCISGPWYMTLLGWFGTAFSLFLPSAARDVIARQVSSSSGNSDHPDLYVRHVDSVWPSAAAPVKPAAATPHTILTTELDDEVELQKICREMTADGTLDEEEIYDLKHWLDDHPHVVLDGLARLLADQIRDVLADGEISVYEAFDLLDLAEALAQGKTLADMADWRPLAPFLDAQLAEPERPRSKTRSGRRVEGGKLDTIRFAYRNAEGEYSERRVVVRVLDDDYFEGRCLSRQATRTFRLDRIIGEVTSEATGEVAEPYAWAAGLGHVIAPRSSVAIDIEVLFTGFRQAERVVLEELAEAAGMVVRKSVTQNLTYLCVGPKAGPSKLEQANERGAKVINKEEFAALV